MQIRYATLMDKDAICRLEKTLFAEKEQIAPEVLERYAETPLQTSLVIEQDGRVLAYLLLCPSLTSHVDDTVFTKRAPLDQETPYLAIACLGVCPDVQQQGYGTLLLAAAKELSVARGYQGLTLTCHDELVAYYVMNGFVHQGVSTSQLGGYVWQDLFWEQMID